MNWLETLRTIIEEGKKAKREGKEIFDNPYSFMHEAQQAYAWEDGYKKAAR